MTKDRNEREFSLVDVAIAVEVMRPDEDPVVGEVEVISMNGMLIRTPSTLPAGLNCRARLVLRGGVESIAFDVSAEVVRSHEETIALAFVEVPIESYTHLKNIVLANSADTDRIEGELANHLGIKPKRS